MNLVLLDYDGYIAKSFYAGIDRDKLTDFSECYKCLYNMEGYVYAKAEPFFAGEDFKVMKIVSGHTIKKDLYPSYKAQRKNDEALGAYRDEIKKWDDITIAEHEEADDLIIRLNEKNRDKSIVFSDDKDLHKYCKWTCKLNEDFLPTKEHFSKEEQLIQLISGDFVDNVKGVPNTGDYRAKKYLKKEGYTLENVIKLYKQSNIDIDECIKNLILVHPFAKGVLDIEVESMYDVVRELSSKVKEVYNEV